MPTSPSASAAPGRPRHLRIVTSNLWLGLDHHRPLLVPPLETRREREARMLAVEQGLRSVRLDPDRSVDQLTVFSLQEVNPVRRLSERLARAVAADGVERAEVNTGVRIGGLSWPPFLQEGLALIWCGAFAARTVAPHRLSGGGWEIRVPGLDLSIGAHLSSRRGALVLSGEWLGLKLCLVDLHVHHAAPVAGKISRRQEELEKLLSLLEPEMAGADATFLTGDFNCDRSHPELKWLERQGFEALSRDGDGAPLVTWDPSLNALCRKNTDANKVPEELAWESVAQQLDHVLCRRSPSFQPSWRASARRVFDSAASGIWMSDHCGVVVDLAWGG